MVALYFWWMFASNNNINITIIIVIKTIIKKVLSFLIKFNKGCFNSMELIQQKSIGVFFFTVFSEIK